MRVTITQQVSRHLRSKLFQGKGVTRMPMTETKPAINVSTWHRTSRRVKLENQLSQQEGNSHTLGQPAANSKPPQQAGLSCRFVIASLGAGVAAASISQPLAAYVFRLSHVQKPTTAQFLATFAVIGAMACLIAWHITPVAAAFARHLACRLPARQKSSNSYPITSVAETIDHTEGILLPHQCGR